MPRPKMANHNTLRPTVFQYLFSPPFKPSSFFLVILGVHETKKALKTQVSIHTWGLIISYLMGLSESKTKYYL